MSANGNGSARLSVRGVETYYGKIVALRCVDIEFHSGEIVTLIGANGAGKSSILQAISGMLPVARGRVILAGDDLLGVPAHLRVQRGIAHVPEGRGIFGNLTVLENLRLATYLRRDAEIRRDLEEVFRLFPRLEERRWQWGNTLSGGEQQMLAIGRALMARPKLMLLDEPSLGLSPLLVKEIFGIIKEINEKEKTTILLVEQNARVALSISSYGYIMENGKVVLDGETSILANNEDVKEFYLGMTEVGTRKSYKDTKHYKRRKRWLS